MAEHPAREASVCRGEVDDHIHIPQKRLLMRFIWILSSNSKAYGFSLANCSVSGKTTEHGLGIVMVFGLAQSGAANIAAIARTAMMIFTFVSSHPQYAAFLRILAICGLKGIIPLLSGFD
jgi:hypothetical protein